MIIIVAFVFMAIAGPWFYPDRLPYDVDNIYAPISWEHPLSTDFEGVDVLALVITGTRGVLLVAVAAGLVTMLVGTAAGLYAGYRRGAADSMLMRIADFALTIPGFPLLIVLTTAMDFGAWWKMALVLGLIGWGGLARAVRSQTLSLRERGFIEAARGLGLPTRHIVTKELLPNVAPFIATNLLMAVTGYIYAQVGLYFLGVLPLDTSNWGVMLNAAVFQSGALISPGRPAVPASPARRDPPADPGRRADSRRAGGDLQPPVAGGLSYVHCGAIREDLARRFHRWPHHRLPHRRRASWPRSATSRSTFPPAPSPAWSANPAPASPRSRCRCSARSRNPAASPRARWSSTASATSPNSTSVRCKGCAARASATSSRPRRTR